MRTFSLPRSRVLLLIGAVPVMLPTLIGTAAVAMETGGGSDSVEAYLGVSGTGLSRLNRRLEENLSICMKKEGFQYTPEAPAVPADALDGGASNRRQFVGKYGYGIATLTPVNQPAKSANLTYLEKQSPADRHSYYIALVGNDPEKPSGASSAQGFTPTSCVGKVVNEVFGNFAAAQQLQNKYDGIDKRINADTAVVRAMRDWSACMKASGYSYARDADIPTDLSTRLSKLQKPASGAGAVLGAAVTADVPGLKKLQKEELAIAKADWECSKKHLAVRDKVAAQLRKDFIAQNKAALDPLKKVFGGK